MDNQNFKDKFKIVIVGIVVLFLLILAFFGGIGYQKKTTSAAEQYLQQQIQVAQQDATYWKSRCDSIYRVQSDILKDVDSLELQIKELKKNYGQKITIIKSYTNPELERFFSNRYGN